VDEFMDDIRVTYYGHVFDASGYGQAARAYVHALDSAGVSLSIVDLTNNGRAVHDDVVASLLGRRQDPDFHLFHGIPPQWARLAFRLPNTIGMTVWETDTMPTQWRNILSHVIEVWLPSEFNVETFRRSLRTPIFRLPHPVFARPLNGDLVDPSAVGRAAPSDFVFYSIFEWQDRKGPAEMLRAFFRAFPEDRDALLVLKTNPGAAGIGAAAEAQTRKETGSAARVSLCAEAWTEGQIEALHRRGDCYVSLHRGEGWGYPLFEAVSRGKPTIATGFSGPLDYLTPSAARLVPFTLAPVQQRYVYYAPQMRWAEPDVDHAATLMREVHSDRADAGQKAAELAPSIRDAFALERVGAMAKERLLALLKGRNHRRWCAVQISGNGAPAAPPVPVPGAWYDEDYFEHGLKSNWTGPYSWQAFSGLFREAAAYLVELLPDAQSYLDAGCAKGFLVRTLRDAGRECWGFDHSSWAIAHAEPAVRPFLQLAGVDDYAFDRRVDILLAFDLLQHLSEEQARRFLVRAREWTGMAIVAVIPSFENDDEEQRHRERRDDRDKSHVTIRQRRWWEALFMESGWRLDPLQRLGAERFRQHQLPRGIGWKVYVYAS
jgi:glycosyltransferase involved in cell wall biosynthesis